MLLPRYGGYSRNRYTKNRTINLLLPRYGGYSTQTSDAWGEYRLLPRYGGYSLATSRAMASGFWLLPRYGGYSNMPHRRHRLCDSCFPVMGVILWSKVILRHCRQVASPLWGLFPSWTTNSRKGVSCFPVMGVIPRYLQSMRFYTAVASPLWGLFYLTNWVLINGFKLLPRYGGYSNAKQKRNDRKGCFPVMGVILDIAPDDKVDIQLLPRYGGYSF